MQFHHLTLISMISQLINCKHFTVNKIFKQIKDYFALFLVSISLHEYRIVSVSTSNPCSCYSLMLVNEWWKFFMRNILVWFRFSYIRTTTSLVYIFNGFVFCVLVDMVVFSFFGFYSKF